MKKIVFLIFFMLLVFFLWDKSGIKIPASGKVFAKKTVILDPGHGLPDGGAVSPEGYSEEEINLKIAKKLEKHLKKAGIKVILTRSGNNSLSDSKTNNKRDDLNKRVEIINSSNANLLVSIHLNHFSEPKYHGAQIFYSKHNDENQRLASNLKTNIVKLLDPENNREIKETADIFILKNTKIPACLAECGFLSNPEEAEKLNTDEYQEKVAWALYCGICDFLQGY